VTDPAIKGDQCKSLPTSNTDFSKSLVNLLSICWVIWLKSGPHSMAYSTVEALAENNELFLEHRASSSEIEHIKHKLHLLRPCSLRRRHQETDDVIVTHRTVEFRSSVHKSFIYFFRANEIHLYHEVDE
jgi:hypothetical protein